MNMMKNKPLLASILVAIVLSVGAVSMYPTAGIGKAYAESSSTKSPFQHCLHPPVRDVRTLKRYCCREVLTLYRTMQMVSRYYNSIRKEFQV